MTTIDALDLAAAGFRDEMERLAALTDEMEWSGGDRGAVTAEIDTIIDRLPDLHDDAQQAYLTAKAWQLEVDACQDEIPDRVVEQERDAMDAVIQDYQKGRQALDEARPYLESQGYDIAFLLGEDTEIYDHDEYVEDMEFDIEFDGGIYTVIDALDTVYRTATSLYNRVR
ncbi:MAG: hypothetical protein SVU32_04335 [Candidatus Nanohaloarchaea archaeon]|nr:hypothetical protein [Candidatus Nanohaloarchaea archaeon]